MLDPGRPRQKERPGSLRLWFDLGSPVRNWALTGFLLLIGLALAVVCNITMATRDPLWFQTGFADLPGRIVVYHAGQQAELRPGDPGFDQLAEAVRSSLAQGAVRKAEIGLSPNSQQEAYEKNVSVEAFFDEPVKLHAPFPTGQPTHMLFLITGRHSDLPLVFMGNDGRYRGNTAELRTITPIREAVASLGYLE
jgi:hypothetical protein